MSDNTENASGEAAAAPARGPPPRWRRLIRGIKLSPSLQVLAIIISLGALVAAFRIPWGIQAHRERLDESKITYAVSITPNPPPGSATDADKYWVSTVMVWNSGPATAKTMVIHLHTPSPDVFPHSPPKLGSAPAAARVTINERTPEGIYEVVLQDFSPGDSVGFRIYYRADGDFGDRLRREWSSEMFSRKFAEHFVEQFWFSGENLHAENLGMLDLPLTFR